MKNDFTPELSEVLNNFAQNATDEELMAAFEEANYDVYSRSSISWDIFSPEFSECVQGRRFELPAVEDHSVTGEISEPVAYARTCLLALAAEHEDLALAA